MGNGTNNQTGRQTVLNLILVMTPAQKSSNTRSRTGWRKSSEGDLKDGAFSLIGCCWFKEIKVRRVGRFFLLHGRILGYATRAFSATFCIVIFGTVFVTWRVMNSRKMIRQNERLLASPIFVAKLSWVSIIDSDNTCASRNGRVIFIIVDNSFPNSS